MCGIVGFTGKSAKQNLKAMTDSIKHRGPDDEAFISFKNFHVGYRRLAIIDLSQNIYPISNEKQTLELVLNGEIYNYTELKKELESLGHTFKTGSDSETIVHGYEQWGYDVVQKLRGMFVFVLVDKEKNEMFIARDRLGIKPFYYALDKSKNIYFGSEIKGILQNKEISREPDDLAVYRFLTARIHDVDEHTFFKSVKRLLPGHFMKIKQDSQFEIVKYWNPEVNTEFSSKKSDKEYAQEFKELFSEAVNLHLIGDVPVGVTLSGGLDSSGITALAHKLYVQNYGKANMYAFSAIHPGETIDESKYIDSVVEHTGVTSVKIVPKVDNFWEELENWVYFQEEPVISGAPYAYNVVMKEARKKVTVLLSGQGGDELLAGYIPYFLSYVQTAKDSGKYWQILRESVLGFDLYAPFVLGKIKNRLSNRADINFKHPLNIDFVKEFEKMGADFNHQRGLNQRLFDDVTKSTTPALLRYEDKNSMNHSLESRVPFFDHKVVEYIFKLPVDQKIKFGWNRYIYRQAMKDIIPSLNRKRRSKVGFTNPEWEWIERKADNFRSIFSSISFKNRKYWNAGLVLDDFEDAIAGKTKGDVMYFWRLFITEMWMRVYVD